MPLDESSYTRFDYSSVGPRAVHELLHDVPRAVQLGNRFKLPIVEKSFHQHPIYFLAHQPVLAVINSINTSNGYAGPSLYLLF